MEIQPFFIEFYHNNAAELAEIKPCCQQTNIYYYDVSMRNKYQFTITPTSDEHKGMAWKISFKNADKHVDPELIEAIGGEIEKHIMMA